MINVRFLEKKGGKKKKKIELKKMIAKWRGENESKKHIFKK